MHSNEASSYGYAARLLVSALDCEGVVVGEPSTVEGNLNLVAASFGEETLRHRTHGHQLIGVKPARLPDARCQLQN